MILPVTATSAPRHGGLLRAVLTLVAGGAIAQALPLLLGPWLSRLYTPQQFGQYNLFAAVSANVAVVACARYEFALPLLGDAVRRRGPACAVPAGAGVRHARERDRCRGRVVLRWSSQGWTAWLPVAVAVLGWLSLATLWATRAQAYRALAIARVVQYGGASLAQAGAALAGGGRAGIDRRADRRRRGGRGGAAPAAGWRCRAARARGAGASWQRRFRDFPAAEHAACLHGRAAGHGRPSRCSIAWQGPDRGRLLGAVALRYLKAPATLVGGAVSQTLYPQLAAHGASADHDVDAHAPLRVTREGRAAVRRVMAGLAALAAPLVLLLWAFAPWAFERLFGAEWRGAGELARTLGLYIGVHFVAAPLAVVTLAWGAQAWALRLALVGQVAFVAALAAGLKLGGLPGAGWGVSIAMTLYFGYYFASLATWPLSDKDNA